jgi:hypothetical protein
MPLRGEPIELQAMSGSEPREAAEPIFRCKECKVQRRPSIRERREPGHQGKSSLPDISEIYNVHIRKGSLLQLANATVVLENGHGLSNTDHLLWG